VSFFHQLKDSSQLFFEKKQKGSRDFQDFFLWTRYFRLFLSRAPFSAFSRGFLPQKKEGEIKQKWVGLLLRARA
jgi:hypothetical protein